MIMTFKKLKRLVGFFYTESPIEIKEVYVRSRKVSNDAKTDGHYPLARKMELYFIFH